MVLMVVVDNGVICLTELTSYQGCTYISSKKSRKHEQSTSLNTYHLLAAGGGGGLGGG